MDRRPPLPTVFRGTSGCLLLPTKRKRSNTPRPVKIYNKDITCLPHQPGNNVLIPISCGEKKSKLADLIGKIALHSVWQAAQVEAEVSSVFASVFGLPQGEVLPYIYLRYNTHQITGFCIACERRRIYCGCVTPPQNTGGLKQRLRIRLRL